MGQSNIQSAAYNTSSRLFASARFHPMPTHEIADKALPRHCATSLACVLLVLSAVYLEAAVDARPCAARVAVAQLRHRVVSSMPEPQLTDHPLPCRMVHCSPPFSTVAHW
jgi:hypothetical protein